MPGLRARSQLCRAALIAVLAVLAPVAAACTSSGTGNALVTFTLGATQGPGTVVVNSAPPAWMNGCDASQPQALEVGLEPGVMRAVGTVEYRGRTYATYELDATSPLFFFPVNVKTSLPGQDGGYELFQAAEPSPTAVTAVVDGRNQVMTYPYVGLVVRHGMQSLPETELATEVVQHTAFPHSNRHTLRVAVSVTAATCALRDATPTLPAVSADVLAQAGDTSPTQAISVEMDCTARGIGVRLTLADALDAANTGSALTPTAQTTSTGVRVQLLRGDVPVAFGTPWEHGVSRPGVQNIAFGARLQRQTGAFAPGLIVGQAVLTADYH